MVKNLKQKMTASVHFKETNQNTQEVKMNAIYNQDQTKQSGLW